MIIIYYTFIQLIYYIVNCSLFRILERKSKLFFNKMIPGNNIYLNIRIIKSTFYTYLNPFMYYIIL